MGVTKTILVPGNGKDKAARGDEIVMRYTGWIYDSSKANAGYKGKMFDTSASRGDFDTQIGVGNVIRGWDDGVLVVGGGMSLGEKAMLLITSDFAYGSSGFPNLIPANSDLLFEVELVGINEKRV